MIGDARVLRDRLVRLVRAGVEIAERVGRVPVARLVLHHAEVLRDGVVDAALPKQFLRLLQRVFTIEGHEGLHGDVRFAGGLPVHPIKQGLGPERSPMDVGVAESRDRVQVIAGGVSLVAVEAVAGIGRVQFQHHPVARHLGHDRGRGNRRARASP